MRALLPNCAELAIVTRTARCAVSTPPVVLTPGPTNPSTQNGNAGPVALPGTTPFDASETLAITLGPSPGTGAGADSVILNNTATSAISLRVISSSSAENASSTRNPFARDCTELLSCLEVS